MSRSRRSVRRGAVAATLALALAPLASACSSGTDAATNQLKPDTPHTKVGTVRVQNLTLVTGDEGTDLVSLGGAFVNEGSRPETLTKVTLEGAPAPAELHSAAGDGPITIPAGGAVYLTGGADKAVFGNTQVKHGAYVRITLSFATVGETTLGVPVHDPEGYYAPLKPTPAAPAVPSPVPSAPAASPTTAETPAAPPVPGQPATEPTAPASPPATGTPAATATATNTPSAAGAPATPEGPDAG
ncbi:hypothetical protein LO772_15720 [Yinghuangia sp. ASG 101]|uniref:hypothetical protein n=1 Tax=Yinghuangia sp. ASG 101 TaxID=2896848 RepID=UPI001E2A1FF8|nr:hypothetical protein [Yinghuangia sp. ASG 101]UGQ14891.1 hypothetical protein LO772_15720 [Yinghuangia sp. ASG 101]